MSKPFAPGFILLLVLSIGLLASCSKSNDQRDFENEALSTPSGITETNANGEVIRTDNDDWRVGPMYRGLISIGSPDTQPPYPNPLPYNQNLNIGFFLRSIETLNRLEIYSFKNVNDLIGPIYTVNGLNPPGYEEISLSGSNISGSTGGSSANGLYRILIYDGQQNLITYGDVQIGTTQ